MADGQISEYYNSDNRYLLLSIAKKNHQITKEGTSVNLGLKITDQLKAKVNFLNDPKLIQKTVHTTCQRCIIEDCLVRAADPEVIEKQNELNDIESELKKL